MTTRHFGLSSTKRLVMLWLGVVLYSFWPTPESAKGQDISGFTALKDQLQAAGVTMPTGAGIVVEQVEATPYGPGQYLPDPASPVFSGKSFLDLTGSGQVSSHATNVGLFFYSSLSDAPGITQIDCYEKTDWLANVVGVDGSAAPALPPSNGPSIINCSWVGSYAPDAAADVDALRRLDYMIDRDHTLVTVAVAYPGSPAVPALMASSYNAIAVGLLNGTGSQGPTVSGDVPGRSKPDIVGPDGATSYCAPDVAATGALLLQVARENPALAAADGNPAVIKAILMASANKDAVAQFNRSPAQPLDPVFGAGLLNVQHAYDILTAGPQVSSTSSVVAATGWSAASVGLGRTQTYFLDVPAEQTFDFSALVTWNRQISCTAGAPGSAATLTPSLAQIDLKLYQVNNGFQLGTLIDSSTSSIDNVQDVFERYFPPGRYALQLSRADALSGDPGSYGLAWQLLPVSPSCWASAVSGSWADGTKWSSNPNIPSGTEQRVVLNAATTALVTVTLDSPQSVGTLLLGNSASSTTGYTLAAGVSGTLTLDNGGNTAQITVTDGRHMISAPVFLNDSLSVAPSAGSMVAFQGSINASSSGLSLSLIGLGVLILSGTDSYTGGTNVETGTLYVARSSAIAVGTSLTVGAGGTFVFDPSQAVTAPVGLTQTRAQIPASSAALVPEPTTLALLSVVGIVASAAAWWRRGN